MSRAATERHLDQVAADMAAFKNDDAPKTAAEWAELLRRDHEAYELFLDVALEKAKDFMR